MFYTLTGSSCQKSLRREGCQPVCLKPTASKNCARAATKIFFKRSLCVPAAQQNSPDSMKIKREKFKPSSLHLGPISHTTFQFNSTLSELAAAQRTPVLTQLYLSWICGEEEHDGEARKEARVLDCEGDEEPAATGVLFLTAHLVHLWKLRRVKQR